MFSFCIIASKQRHVGLLLKKSSEKVMSILSNYSEKLECNQFVSKDNTIGYYIIKPKTKVIRKQIHIYRENDIEVVLYGELYLNSFESNYAEILYRKYKLENLNEARRLNGCYSACIIDYRSNNIIIISDVVGQRKLFYHDQNDTIIISSQDIPIFHTGLVQKEIDLKSMYSILAFDNSFYGKSLLRDIYGIQNTEYLTWKDGITKRHYQPLLIKDCKIDPKNFSAQKKTVQTIADQIISNIKLAVKHSEKIIFDLTAGLDSRAMLAILLTNFSDKTLVPQTMGSPQSPEVKSAKKISKRFNLKHIITMPELQSVNDFDYNANKIAFSTNGTTTSLFAISKKQVLKDINDLHIGSQGGDAFRGFFYHNRSKTKIESYSLHKVTSLVQKRNFISNLQINDYSIHKWYNRVIAEFIQEYSTYSPDKASIFDLVYLFQRLSNWASFRSRCNWNLNYFTPFMTSKVIENMYKLPAYFTLMVPIHDYFIKQLPSSIYNMSYNNNPFKRISFITDEQHLQFYYKLERIYDKVLINKIRLSNYLTPKTNLMKTKSHNAVRYEIHYSLLKEYTYNLLMNPDSLTLQLFNKDTVSLLLENHFSGEKNQLSLISKLISIELWRLML